MTTEQASLSTRTMFNVTVYNIWNGERVTTFYGFPTRALAVQFIKDLPPWQEGKAYAVEYDDSFVGVDAIPF